ncbi:hypothetical protein AX16_001146 [Volvariella volvacea WC 439]|nr:hypothetical protein AX16_001146 [Volvariella volvacea WC 439]
MDSNTWVLHPNGRTHAAPTARRGVYYRVLKPEDLDNARIPYIPEKEIKDHGKGDILAKAIVVFQTTWFTIQCIVRPIQGLAIAEIELVALAFAILNAITYGLWWDKPLNIEYPIYFDEEGKRVDGPGPEDAQSSEAWYEFSMWGKNIDLRDKRDVLALLCLAPLMILIAIPLAVNSITEMVYIGSGDRASDTNNDPETSVHPFYAAKMDNTDFTKNWVLTKVLHFFAQLLDVLVIISMLAYVSSRFIILFLAIFSLRSLPDSVYESIEWTEFIPHI